jgi:hypothetical protein
MIFRNRDNDRLLWFAASSRELFLNSGSIAFNALFKLFEVVSQMFAHSRSLLSLAVGSFHESNVFIRTSGPCQLPSRHSWGNRPLYRVYGRLDDFVYRTPQKITHT